VSNTGTVLVVDDDEFIREAYRLHLEGDGYDCAEAASVDAARELILGDDSRPDVVILDLMLGVDETDGLKLLEALLDRYPTLPILMSTASRKVEHAIFALKRGAFDYLVKPVSREQLLLAVRNAVERSAMHRELAARRALDTEPAEGAEFGFFKSTAMKLLLSSLERAKHSRVPILVLGESGVGKEVVSHWVHRTSRWRDGPFVAVNCAALPSELVESELFGHKKGAFTGADADRDGRFVQADGGTLFLDEIGELEPGIQAKLLRVLEQREVTPVGGTVRSVDTRVVAATNRDLVAEVKAGNFREDLYYRLEVFTVRVPPLRERQDEIVALARYFLDRFCDAEGFPALALSPEAEEALCAHAWPGNVRELQNAMKRAALKARGAVLSPQDIDLQRPATPAPLGQSDKPIREEIRDDNRERMLRALAETHGNVAAAARRLEIGRSTFYRWARQYGIPI
jgi:DNA-binding NtrC family response regulator